MRRHLHGLVALALAAPLAACEDEDPPTGRLVTGDPAAPAPPASGDLVHRCRVIIEAERPEAVPVTGQATAASEEEATEAAWQEACSQLPPTERPACHDSTRWHPTVTVGRGAQITVSVALRPADPPQINGQAISNESAVDACHHAVLDACEQAGASGDCVAAGTHRRVGEAMTELVR